MWRASSTRRNSAGFSRRSCFGNRRSVIVGDWPKDSTSDPSRCRCWPGG
jgi:hypothetical protein